MFAVPWSRRTLCDATSGLQRRRCEPTLAVGQDRRRHRLLARFGLTCAALFLAQLAFALDPGKSIFQFNVQNWTRQSGLPADKVNAVAQTGDGFVWLGTQNGLVRFDGLEFTAVPIDLTEARGQDVRVLTVAPNGSLWFAITNGSYGNYDGERFSRVEEPRWLKPDIRALAVLPTRDGAVWLGANLAWGRWKKDQPRHTIVEGASTSVLMLAEEPDTRRVWMGTSQRGLFYWADETFVPFPDEALKAHHLYAFAKTPDGHIWIGTERGLFRYDRDFVRQETIAPDQQINALLVDRHGVLWAGTHRRGLLRIQHGVLTGLNRDDGLAGDYVTSLFEDAEGSLWVGTLDGLSQLSDLKFPIFSAQEGLHEGGGITVTAAREGGVWITTPSGATWLDVTRAPATARGSLLANHYVRRSFEARNGDLYFADGERNIAVFRQGQELRRYAFATWPEAIAEDDESVLFAVGPTLYRERGELVPFTLADGSVPDWKWINHLCVARDGAIWVASSNGIFRLEDGVARQWSLAEGLLSTRVHVIAEDSDGTIWAGLPTGMARIKGDRLRTIGLNDGLHNDKIYAIVPDDLGYFWIASGRGYFRVRRQGLNDFADGTAKHVPCEAFDGLESVKFSDRSEQGYSGCKTNDGRIWFPNPRGVVMIDPAAFFLNRVPPRVYVTRVRVDGRSRARTAPAVLTPGEHSLEFDFAALSYIAPKKVRVRYRLEGLDADWVEAGARRSATYSRVRPGQYAFQVQAANADGVWNRTGDSFSVKLPAPFHRTPWFYSLVGLTIAVGLLAAYRWKLRHMQRAEARLRSQNDLLEEKVGARTRELADSLSLLKATLDSTRDGVLAIHFSGRVVSYNAHFVEMWGLQPDALHRDDDIVSATARLVKDPAQFRTRIEEIHANPETDAFDVIELDDGRTIERYCRPQRIEGKCVGIVINFRDITARNRAEAQLAEVHKQLLESSRQAGMAEVATSVLHNVGNVLNSVNVSATVAIDRVHASKVGYVPKVSALLREHLDDLPQFFTSDPKGQKLPAYLENLGKQLVAEQGHVIDELKQLRKYIEHIKEIVAMQQSYARVSGVAETVVLTDVVEDAIRMNAGALTRHAVTLVRDYRAAPTVTLERHKVMQVLINLIRNAKYACETAPGSNKQITLRTVQTDDAVRISVIDNGVGIPAENLTRIFSHGFTTKKEGHGFGLHSGAIVARELGGTLTAASEGPGLGATFTLELPLASQDSAKYPPTDLAEAESLRTP